MVWILSIKIFLNNYKLKPLLIKILIDLSDQTIYRMIFVNTCIIICNAKHAKKITLTFFFLDKHDMFTLAMSIITCDIDKTQTKELVCA